MEQMDFYKYDEFLRDKLTTSEERVYRTIMSYRNNLSSEAFPSQDTIVIRGKISLSTVKRAVKSLILKGFLSIRKMKRIIGHYNVYIMNYIPSFYVQKSEDVSKIETKSDDTQTIENQIESENTYKINDNNILVEENQKKPLENAYNGLDILEDFSDKSFERVDENNKNSSLVEGKLGLTLSKWQSYIANSELEYGVLLQVIGLFKKKKGRTFTFLLRLYLNFIPEENLTKEFLEKLKIDDIIIRDIEK